MKDDRSTAPKIDWSKPIEHLSDLTKRRLPAHYVGRDRDGNYVVQWLDTIKSYREDGTNAYRDDGVVFIYNAKPAPVKRYFVVSPDHKEIRGPYLERGSAEIVARHHQPEPHFVQEVEFGVR